MIVVIVADETDVDGTGQFVDGQGGGRVPLRPDELDGKGAVGEDGIGQKGEGVLTYQARRVSQPAELDAVGGGGGSEHGRRGVDRCAAAGRATATTAADVILRAGVEHGGVGGGGCLGGGGLQILFSGLPPPLHPPPPQIAQAVMTVGRLGIPRIDEPSRDPVPARQRETVVVEPRFARRLGQRHDRTVIQHAPEETEAGFETGRDAGPCRPARVDAHGEGGAGRHHSSQEGSTAFPGRGGLEEGLLFPEDLDEASSSPRGPGRHTFVVADAAPPRQAHLFPQHPQLGQSALLGGKHTRKQEVAHPGPLPLPLAIPPDGAVTVASQLLSYLLRRCPKFERHLRPTDGQGVVRRRREGRKGRTEGLDEVGKRRGEEDVRSDLVGMEAAVIDSVERQGRGWRRGRERERRRQAYSEMVGRRRGSAVGAGTLRRERHQRPAGRGRRRGRGGRRRRVASQGQEGCPYHDIKLSRESSRVEASRGEASRFDSIRFE
mmetsp:Transcript_25355/g.74614  ORF Transcript_25355/g.74614 Transcript_25355/m.74614 type:complete len:491 (+) Transcript_25355:872-2344(+)